MNASEKRLTLGEAIKDLGWFSTTFSAIVGGPSIVALLQMVFVERRLVDALQWIVDGYNDIVATISAMLEPPLGYLIAELNEWLGWRLTLHAHWRPLFMLMMLVVVALLRIAPRLGSAQRELFGELRGALIAAPLMALGAISGAVAAGLVSLSAGWWAQGLAAATPIALTFLGVAIARLLSSKADTMSHDVVMAYAIGAMWAWAAWLLGVALSFVPFIHDGAGMIALAVSIIFVGYGLLQYGLEEADVFRTRLALTILGGFVTAGLIVAADLALKLIS